MSYKSHVLGNMISNLENDLMDYGNWYEDADNTKQEIYKDEYNKINDLCNELLDLLHDSYTVEARHEKLRKQQGVK